MGTYPAHVHTHEPCTSASPHFFDCSVSTKCARPLGVTAPDTGVVGPAAATASGMCGFESSNPCVPSPPGIIGWWLAWSCEWPCPYMWCRWCGWWACGGAECEVGTWACGAGCEDELEWAGESGMEECGECTAGLAVPEFVDERVIWGRFCVDGQARPWSWHAPGHGGAADRRSGCRGADLRVRGWSLGLGASSEHGRRRGGGGHHEPAAHARRM